MTAPRPSANGTEEVHLDDILDEWPIEESRDLPSIAPVALSVTPPPVHVRPLSPRRARDLVEVPAPPRRAFAPWVVGGVALGTLATLGVLVAMRVYDARAPRAVSSVTVVQATGVRASAAPPAHDDTAIPTVPLDNLPIVPSTRGTLRFTAGAKSHRVYVDGAIVGEANGPIDVKCGPRAVRVGSRGEVQTIDVPCGGDVLVLTR